MDWLMIVCIIAGERQYCTDRGSITALMVSEAQCRAMLTQPSYDTSTYVRCVSPKGEVFHNVSRRPL